MTREEAWMPNHTSRTFSYSHSEKEKILALFESKKIIDKYNWDGRPLEIGLVTSFVTITCLSFYFLFFERTLEKIIADVDPFFVILKALALAMRVFGLFIGLAFLVGISIYFYYHRKRLIENQLRYELLRFELELDLLPKENVDFHLNK